MFNFLNFLPVLLMKLQIKSSWTNNLCITFICFPGTNPEGKPVYLRDIWPTRDEIQVQPPFLFNFQKIDDTANSLYL